MSSPFIFKLRIYIEDTDAGGIVYYANYLRFAERARTEAMRALGVPHSEMIAQHGRMFVVHRINLVYQRPARLDDEIMVKTFILTISGASLQLRQEFWRDNDSLGVLEVSLGCVSRDTGRAARIPAESLAGLRAGLE
ncbi:MAG: tol-pal system-associated acyl-CoA thioesterase [Acidocella sp. 20-57-95]|nr:MAG: tol-pal system-associated acyl-CoA thioesterase [Acidocella sp. 20-57-95]OYV58085.1 MAG: tol-pal system-associated acyl-CoA thioesterase [Acidocella sp. 21-58-7]HQT64639.1 tol-pal system-associated acyl-CoA thioesterase [Acidocella sp.]HQU05159.1 tol-pal system-associated acyl-CoA thioesterase [Acidocella sp.]